MAKKQAIAAGYPYPVYVNETATKQRIAPGVMINETVAATATTKASTLPMMGVG